MGNQLFLLRPFIIVSAAVVLQNFYLIFFLTFVAQRGQPETRSLNRSLAITFFIFNLLIIHNALLVTSSNIWIDATTPLRSIEVIAMMYFACRFVYKMLGTVTDAFVTQRRWFQRVFGLLVIIDVCIILTRILPVLGSAAPAQRPLYLETPLLLSQLWLIMLTVQAWRYVENSKTRRKACAFCGKPCGNRKLVWLACYAISRLPL